MHSSKGRGRPPRRTDNRQVRIELFNKRIPKDSVGAALAEARSSLTASNTAISQRLLLCLLLQLETISTKTVADQLGNIASNRYYSEVAKVVSKASQQLKAYLK